MNLVGYVAQAAQPAVSRVANLPASGSEGVRVLRGTVVPQSMLGPTGQSATQQTRLSALQPKASFGLGKYLERNPCILKFLESADRKRFADWLTLTQPDLIIAQNICEIEGMQRIFSS